MQRLNGHIDPESFKELIDISLKFNWLLEYNIELAEIWNLYPSPKERELLKHLFSQFLFIRSRDIREIAKSIKNKIITKWNLSSDNTFLVATSDNSEADGSQALLQLIKQEFGGINYWKERNFKNRISCIRELDNNSNILLLDDFIGSGKTANRRIKWVQDENKKDAKNKSSIFFLSMAGMREGIDNIQNLNPQNIYVPNILDKGITDLSPSNKREDYIKIMNKMEEKLGEKYNKKHLRDFKFGYGRAEALYSVEAFSTPNNVFPVFWWPVLLDKSNWRTFFKRL